MIGTTWALAWFKVSPLAFSPPLMFLVFTLHQETGYLENHSMTWSKWLITMVNKGHLGPRPNGRILWPWNGDDPITTYDTWDDPPSLVRSGPGPRCQALIIGLGLQVRQWKNLRGRRLDWWKSRKKRWKFFPFLNKRLQNMSIRHFCEMSFYCRGEWFIFRPSFHGFSDLSCPTIQQRIYVHLLTCQSRKSLAQNTHQGWRSDPQLSAKWNETIKPSFPSPAFVCCLDVFP